MENNSENQLSENVGNDIIEELAHVIPNQQRYIRVFESLWIQNLLYEKW